MQIIRGENLILFISLLCFAGNSLLCRLALREGQIGAELFVLIRLLAGALTLVAIVFSRRRMSFWTAGSWGSAIALFAYAIFFSFAYLQLDAGIGALILFGVVQITMIGWGLRESEAPSRGEWGGLGIAVFGLVLLTLPGKTAPNFISATLMAIAGIAWGAYSLRGRKQSRPLETTAMNFLMALPFALPLYLVSSHSTVVTTPRGIALAIVSGAVTSGIGYALWYRVVPELGAARAGIAQLAVPAMAILLSVTFLDESVSFRTGMSMVLILSGVGWALVSRGGRTK